MCCAQEKESYTQLAERENEKRRREHIFELRDRAIAEWEEEEARRRGLLGSNELDTTTEHTRGVLLAVRACHRVCVFLGKRLADCVAVAVTLVGRTT